MDPKQIESHLRQAEDHVRLGAKHLRQQRRIVGVLERDGHPTAMARDLLHTFEDMQATHIAGRNTFAKELAVAEKEQAQMADDKSKTGKPDRDRINVEEDYELREWAKKFDVTPERLREAVKTSGPMVRDIEALLGKHIR
jgi:hypothetical protein